MYTIKLAEGSSNKLTDTTEFLKLLLLKDSLAFPVTDYTVTFKIGNDSGYLVDVPVDVLRSNEVAISTQSDTFKLLSPDTYQFEVWAEKDNERVIFPTNGTGEFTISDNITGFNGKMLSSVTVNEFLAKVKTTPGAPGESAYQVAVDAGYIGTQAEWLASLKGDKGDTGATGTKGDTGATGKDGVGISSTVVTYQLSTSGSTEPAGTWSDTVLSPTTANPYLWTKTVLTYSDSSTKNLYTISVKGDTGATGENGNTGATGAKGDKGNDAIINIISQADYDALADKSGVYFIEEG